jgi:hypothetical protein
VLTSALLAKYKGYLTVNMSRYCIFRTINLKSKTENVGIRRNISVLFKLQLSFWRSLCKCLFLCLLVLLVFRRLCPSISLSTFLYTFFLLSIFGIFYDAFSVPRLYSVDDTVTAEWWWWIDEDKQPCLKRDSNPLSQSPRDQGLRFWRRGRWERLFCCW